MLDNYYPCTFLHYWMLSKIVNALKAGFALAQKKRSRFFHWKLSKRQSKQLWENSGLTASKVKNLLFENLEGISLQPHFEILLIRRNSKKQVKIFKILTIFEKRSWLKKVMLSLQRSMRWYALCTKTFIKELKLIHT